MHEGIELLKYFGYNDETMGVVLAIVARAQGSSVPAILANLEESQANGSAQARDVLSFYRRADAALQQMAAEARQARLYAGPWPKPAGENLNVTGGVEMRAYAPGL